MPARDAVNAAAPGFVKTDLNQNASGFIASMINFSAKLFAVSPGVLSPSSKKRSTR